MVVILVTVRASIIWTVVLVLAQFIVIIEAIAPRITPLARQFNGWSAYIAIAAMLAILFLFIASPFFWRSHRCLAISGFGVAIGAIITALHLW